MQRKKDRGNVNSWVKWACWLLLASFVVIASVDSVALSQTTPAPALDASQLIEFLNQTIGWYRQLAVEQRTATEPHDQIVVYNNRQIADQVVQLAFDFARAQANALTKRTTSQQTQSVGGSAAPSQYDSLRQMEDTLAKQCQDTQAELESDKQKLASATGRSRQELESQISELQGELALASVRRDTVQEMVEFVSGASVDGVGATGLRAQIEALASSVPAATLNPASNARRNDLSSNPTPTAGSTESDTTERAGIWGLSADIFSVSGEVHTLNSIIDKTNALSKTAGDLREPFVLQLRELSSKGDQLAARADTADPALLAKEKQQLDELAAQFKSISSAVIPLSKQSVLLGLYARNLTDWRDSLQARYNLDLKGLGFRLGLLLLILFIVIGAAELWRRGVYRYVHEPHRRYQFLLIRKFVLGIVIVLIVAFTLAGKLGSVLTFAGLLTAGVAVALQNVILSFVGYFFLIGKFGVHVGDRVQIGGVTGTVIDIGLVRLHVMELSGGALDIPTGRVVAFSNSIVFQSGAGLFKQIPGTSFLWHEITVTVPRGVDFGKIKGKLLGAVSEVLSDYRSELDRQYREMERTMISFPSDGLQPRIHLRVTSSVVEAIIDFPVDPRRGAEIDERVSNAVLKAVEGESKPGTAGSDAPEIHLRTNLSASDVIT